MRGSRGLEIHRSSSTHVAFKGSYNGYDEVRGAHLDRQIAIQGARSKAFYNASQRTSSERFITDRTATTFLKRLTMDRSIITID